MKLTTNYLGLTLAHPFMPGASPLADNLDTVLELEDAGASVIVMRSLFVKAVMAGADAIQVVSALLKKGPWHLTTLRRGFEQWCEAHGYESQILQSWGPLTTPGTDR